MKNPEPMSAVAAEAYARSMGEWPSGKALVSKTITTGSNPVSPAASLCPRPPCTSYPSCGCEVSPASQIFYSTCNNMIRTAVSRARTELVGMEAVLRSPAAGKYRARHGAITDVTADGDGLRACVMVWRASALRPVGPETRNIYLNGDAATRSYWKLEDLLLTGRRVFGGP